jgi:tetrahydromethanopterin S-methyltransferase subunit G
VRDSDIVEKARQHLIPEDSIEQFEQRMHDLREEVQLIDRELGRQDLLALADRTRNLLRKTKALLDGNTHILFAGQPDRIPEELYKHIEYAQGHITKAIADEYEFDTIEKRLYMATALSEWVISGVSEAIARLKSPSEHRES